MQHLLLMRRAIVRKKPVRIVFSTPQGPSAVHLGPGAIAAKNLKRLDDFWFTDTAQSAPAPWDAAQPTVPVQQAVIASINRLAFTETQMHELEAFAAKLPPVHVRLAPLHRFGMKDFTAYIQLHSRFIQHGPVMLSAWLTEFQNGEMRVQRHRVFLITFVLGLLAAPPKEKKGEARPAAKDASPRKSALLQRIIGRIRSMR